MTSPTYRASPMERFVAASHDILERARCDRNARELHEAIAETPRSAGVIWGRRPYLGERGEPIEDFFSDAVMESFASTVPFRQDGPDGFSLVSLDFPPGAMLPRHSHSADCLYYIVSGGIVIGRRELGPGDGFFVPAEQPYGYRAGAEGLKLLEFRHSAAFDTKFHEKNPAHFRAKVEASLAEAAGGRKDTDRPA